MKAVINASFYDVTTSGKLDAFSGHDPVPTAETLPEGQVVINKRLIVGSTQPRLCYIAYHKSKLTTQHTVTAAEAPDSVPAKYNHPSWEPILALPANAAFMTKRTNAKTKKFDPQLVQPGDGFQVPTPENAYSFGVGDPPTDADVALGGLGPLIIGGLKYGNGNLYKAGVPAGAPASGEPAAKYKPYLTQRNDLRYIGQAAQGPRGKGGVALCRKERKMLIFVIPIDAPTGLSHDALRDKLAAVGIDDALFVDGSDSVMLMINNTWRVRQGDNKDELTTLALGFG